MTAIWSLLGEGQSRLNKNRKIIFLHSDFYLAIYVKTSRDIVTSIHETDAAAVSQLFRIFKSSDGAEFIMADNDNSSICYSLMISELDKRGRERQSTHGWVREKLT